MECSSKRMQAIADAISPERVIELTRALVNRRSDSTGDREYAVAMYLKEQFKSMGLETSLQHVEEKRYNVVAR